MRLRASGVQAVPDAQGTLSGRDAWPGLVLRADARVTPDAEAREAPSHDKLQPSLQEVQEHDQGIDRQQDQPIVGGRHHLYRHR